jgi:hypothetical protein
MQSCEYSRVTSVLNITLINKPKIAIAHIFRPIVCLAFTGKGGFQRDVHMRISEPDHFFTEVQVAAHGHAADEMSDPGKNMRPLQGRRVFASA